VSSSARHSAQLCTCASTHSRSEGWMRPVASHGNRFQASACVSGIRGLMNGLRSCPLGRAILV
jgi:hypothetical protein